MHARIWLRQKTAAERVAMCCEYNRMVRLLVGAYISANHHDWDEPKIQQGVSRAMLGPERTQQLKAAGYWS